MADGALAGMRIVAFEARRAGELASLFTRHGAVVTIFTSAAQVAHLLQVAPDGGALRAALGRVVVASIGPMCSEALEAHGFTPLLEASPPKMGPLAALVAERAPAFYKHSLPVV